MPHHRKELNPPAPSDTGLRVSSEAVDRRFAAMTSALTPPVEGAALTDVATTLGIGGTI